MPRFPRFVPAITCLLLLASCGGGGTSADPEPETKSGVVDVLVVDADDRAQYKAVLQSSEGPLPLQFDGMADEDLVRLNGRLLTVRGSYKPTAFAVESYEEFETVETKAIPATARGDKRVLVILSNFTDGGTSCTRSAAAQRLTEIDAIYREMSGDSLSIRGDVVGPFTLPMTKAEAASYYQWANESTKAAVASGVRTSDYHMIQHVGPAKVSWGGIANVGGPQSWVVTCNTALMAHELGHNLSFHHASTPTNTYGDKSDVMASGNAHMMHGPNRSMGEWLAPSATLPVMASGTYEIAPLETSSGAVQVLKLKLPNSDDLWISLRQAIGLDSKLGSAYRDVVTVHTSASWDRMPVTVLRARLAPGQEYADAANGVLVSAVGVQPGKAVVRIHFTGQACTTALPLVTLSPAGQSTSIGGAATYMASIQNRNPAACIPMDFNVAKSSLPAGYTSDVQAKVRIASGQTVTLPWTVGVAPDATVGTKTVSLKAWLSGKSPHTGKATLTVLADKEPDPLPEPEPQPEPVPEPEPQPEPVPESQLQPEPVPQPDLQPQPDPVPPIVDKPGSVVIGASADTYLSKPHPSHKWGTVTTMMQGKNYDPLVRFAVFQSQGGPVPDGAAITSARVRLYKTTAYNIVLGLYRVVSNWSEASTMNTAPIWAATPDAQGSVDWSPGWIEFDVTSSVSSAPLGWRIGRISGYSDTYYKRLASREYEDPALRPQLVVTFQ